MKPNDIQLVENQLQLVTFEQAKRLKAAGFDWETEHAFDGAKNLYSCYCDMIEDAPIDWNNEEGSCWQSAPTVALALKWFRDVKGVTTSISFCDDEFLFDADDDDGAYYGYRGQREKRFSCVQVSIGDSYEEAESALLDALLTELEISKTACE